MLVEMSLGRCRFEISCEKFLKENTYIRITIFCMINRSRIGVEEL